MKGPLLITGATSGVGRSLCIHFARRYQVIAMGRDIRRLESLYGKQPNVSPVAVDLESQQGVQGVVAAILRDHGGIPYLINNAGTLIRGAVHELDAEAWFRAMRVNALAPAQIMAAFLPGMIDRGFGRIINVTSGAPFNCSPGFAAYSASKAALNALTVTAAREVGTADVKINLMSPGPVRSNMAPDAKMDPSVCHATAEYLLELGADGPTGKFFWLGREIPLFPDLSGVRWLEGEADERFARIPLQKSSAP